MRIPFIPVAAICAVVIASNILVQYPVHALGLSDYLTWGAFSYPVAFFVTDLTNRRFGLDVARNVILVGFSCAVALSFYLASPRIAIASASAFLLGQLLDARLFHVLRRRRWWLAPLGSSCVASILDTILFFSLAFSSLFSFIALSDPIAVEQVTSFAGFLVDVPRWVSWAISDFLVKITMGLFLLIPYGVVLRFAPEDASGSGSRGEKMACGV